MEKFEPNLIPDQKPKLKSEQLSEKQYEDLELKKDREKVEEELSLEKSKLEEIYERTKKNVALCEQMVEKKHHNLSTALWSQYDQFHQYCIKDVLSLGFVNKDKIKHHIETVIFDWPERHRRYWGNNCFTNEMEEIISILISDSKSLLEIINSKE